MSQTATSANLVQTIVCGVTPDLQTDGVDAGIVFVGEGAAVGRLMS